VPPPPLATPGPRLQPLLLLVLGLGALASSSRFPAISRHGLMVTDKVTDFPSCGQGPLPWGSGPQGGGSGDPGTARVPPPLLFAPGRCFDVSGRGRTGFRA
jgi:hypothetical protein